MEKQITTIVSPQKSTAAALLLSIFFGPLGLLYSSILGGVIMLIITTIVAIITLGFGLFLTWPICIIWAAIATGRYNKKILEK